jgi:CHAD domain-containing protein
MNDPDPLLDRSPEAAVRMLALARLDDAAAAAGRLESERRGKALHDFRVALRRLRTHFKAYRALLQGSVSKKHARALRDLARSTGGARDAEVQLEWLAARCDELKPAARKACAWLVERIESRRDEAYSSIRSDVLARFARLETRLRRRLSCYSVTVGPETPRASYAGAVGKLVRRTGRELVTALEAARAPIDSEVAHRARIQGKRLRYLVEPLESTRCQEPAKRLVASIKAIQDVLGRLHDVHVLADELATSLAEAAAERAFALHAALFEGKPRPGENHGSGLLAIDRLVRDSVEALLLELRDVCSAARLAALSKEIETLADLLCGHDTRARKRRFLLARLPAIEAAPLEVVQGWIPGLSLQDCLERVISGGEERLYLVKDGAERELEQESNREVFERLWALTEGRQVLKRKYRIAEGDQMWEVDEFKDRDLVMAQTEQSALERLELPDWLSPHVVREVTDDQQYLDERLAR